MRPEHIRPPHVFAGNPMDRGEVERRDEDWIAAQANDPNSRMLAMWQLNVPVSAEQTLRWHSADDVRGLDIETEPIFLGLLEGRSHFVVDVSAGDRESIERSGLIFEDARTTAEYLSGRGIRHSGSGSFAVELARTPRLLLRLRPPNPHRTRRSGASLFAEG